MSHIDERTGKPKLILDLCGGTGSWSMPYKEAGYDVRLITLPEYDVLTYVPPENIYGILAAPPCTEFSVLNCKAEPRKRDEMGGLLVVFGCLRIISFALPEFWAMENPRGALRKYMLNAGITFQPWEFGDAWTKTTDLFGIFVAPETKYCHWEDVPKLELYVRPRREKPSFAYLHKSALVKIPQLAGVEVADDASFRAITPPGFAQAFFEANK